MDINKKKVKHTSLDRVLPVYAVSTVVVSFERREREQTCSWFRILVSHSSRRSTVQQGVVHVVHDRMELLCHV